MAWRYESFLIAGLREKAIAEESAMLNKAETREMTDAPERADIVGLKQNFWATKGPAASLVCCEARVVAPFNHMFVPVARPS